MSFAAALAAAVDACEPAIPIAAPSAHLDRTRSCRQMEETAGSLSRCDADIGLRPHDPAGDLEHGHALIAAGRRAEAENEFRRALDRDPTSGEALMGVARALIEARDIEGAIAAIDHGLSAVSHPARLHMLKGLLHQKRGRFQNALEAFRQAIDLDPHEPMGYHNTGALFQSAGQDALAIPFFEMAARLKPDLVETYIELAEAHRRLGHHSVVAPLFDHAHSLAPERLDIRWMGCWARMQACDWQGHAGRIEALLEDAIAAGHAISPFMIIALGRPALETLLWTRAWAERHMPPSPRPLTRYDTAGGRPRSGRIRLGYLSADFKAHAVARLIMELLCLHDRSRFEVFGYKIGRDDGTSVGQDVAAAIEHMIPLAAFSDREAAERIAADDIEILVDLSGFTADSRPGILPHRPAPIQVNYLGYPGSMGSKAIDYIIADAIVAPAEHQPFFDEAIVHLPHGYQPNDRRRSGADPHATRAAHGLPDDAFVFCCFNNNYKLTPPLFDIWMSLLRERPGSVFWLLQSNDATAANLQAAACDRGIAPDRLIFAPRTGYDAHLARLGLADLFLDTLPYNAHTTSSEALWCGVPVLTCRGTHFASRVAASLLSAIGLPELIVTDLAAYKREALALSHDTERLATLRAKLAANRMTMPLFDTPRFARNYEAALERMVAWREAGRLPAPFAVDEEGQWISMPGRASAPPNLRISATRT